MTVRGDKHARVGISVRTATFGIDGDTLDQLLICADQPMYRVKSEHKQNRSAATTTSPAHTDALTAPPPSERQDDDLASTSVN